MKHRLAPGPEMMLCHQHGLLELSLIFCGASSLVPTDHPADVNRKRVARAMEWYSQHMEKNPGLEEVALAAATSAPHLRRLFHEVMQASPKKVFDQLRFQRAMQMMTDLNVKLAGVSEACGFESPSAFSRAFKTKFGCCPEKWRH